MGHSLISSVGFLQFLDDGRTIYVNRGKRTPNLNCMKLL